MPVLKHYTLPNITGTESLGAAGGFSGAQLTKLHTVDGTYCLRRWPTSHPTYEQLSWIHLVLTHAFREDCDFVAVPIRNREQQTITHFDSSLWELSHWMPGAADFCRDSNDVRLANMVQALAQFHMASAQVSLDFRPSANLDSRIKQLNDLPRLLIKIQQSEIPSGRTLDSSTSAMKILGGWAEKLTSFRQLVLEVASHTNVSLRKQLLRFENQVFAVQPIIRDVWHDHVLFTNNDVTGLIDFGAMQMDNVACDIARLLGSTISDDPARWSHSVEYYNKIRRLTEQEIMLAMSLDRSAVLLGSINWLKWILIEQRVFENLESVAKRIEHLHRRLERF